MGNLRRVEKSYRSSEIEEIHRPFSQSSEIDGESSDENQTARINRGKHNTMCCEVHAPLSI